jgi:hypothetical protein
MVPAGMEQDFIPLEDLIEIYSGFRERTVLRPAAPLRRMAWLRHDVSLTREEVAYALTVTLTMNGLFVLDDGDHLVQIVPARLASQIRSRAPKRAADAETIAPEKVSAFFHSQSDPSSDRNVDNLVAYYARLAGLRSVPSEKVGRNPVTFKVRTPLTRDELLYAIETTLAFDGLVIVHTETNTIHAARLSADGR